MSESFHILLIDDDDVDRMAVRRALAQSQLEANVSEATDATSAIAMLRADHFDCVLLDHRLPDRDGLAVLRDIRAASSIATPVIMMTGQGSEELAVDMMKAGASDYLSKNTVSISRLEQSIRSAVRV